MQTIVIGHRNPDMDSICSALGYARLKQLLGMPNVIAARAGNTNARVDFVLEKFRVEPPVFLSDVSPHVSDVMESNVVSVRAESAIYDAVLLIEQKQYQHTLLIKLCPPLLRQARQDVLLLRFQ